LPWPKDALQSVAEFKLENVEDLPEKDGIVTICVDMQERATVMANRFRDELRRYYYITPTSYLILIKTFTALLEKRRKEVKNDIFKFERGLAALGQAEVEVDSLKKTLEELIPNLKIAEEQSREVQKKIEIEKKEVDRQRKIAGEEAASAKEQKDKATIIKDDCDKALAQVMPIYHSAMKAVKALSAADVTELKAVKKPSAGMLLVA
jgi:dynein heavy chain